MADREDYQHYSDTTSFESLTRHVTYEHEKMYLNLVFQKELPSERPIIDSTKAQRLSFYRIYTTTAAKSNIIETQKVDLNSFLWFYAVNLFFKTLPHCFVHFFLTVFAPEEHMFVTKMVPIAFGCKYLYVLVSVLELTVYADTLVMLFHYAIFGIISKNPWNRCPKREYFDVYHNATIKCYEVKEFMQNIMNKSNDFRELMFLSSEGQHFALAQIDYYRLNVDRTGLLLDTIFFLLIWASVIFIHIETRKRYIWQVLHYSHCSLVALDILMVLYMVLPFQEFDETYPIATISETNQPIGIGLEDIEMFAESITAPQVVHILTARSPQSIDPSQDSSIMVISNALIYMLKGLQSNLIRKFCESLLRTEIPVTQFNQQYTLYFWPIFFQTFYLGDIFSVVYTVTHFVVEFLCAVITINCVMEMILYEWPKLKRWMIMIALGISGVVLYPTVSVNTRLLLWIYGKAIATLADILCIYLMYPLGRLMDDFTFYYGFPPTRMRILSLRVVPVYYILKLYVTFNSLWYVMRSTVLGSELPHYVWSWSIMLVPILVGVLYTMFMYLVKYRMPWPLIFRPTPKWGPRDFSVRQLRKQFDSRFYIGSEAPKLLSRYLMTKRESKVYKIDVRYDMQRRSTVSKAVGFGFGEEFRQDKKIKQM